MSAFAFPPAALFVSAVDLFEHGSEDSSQRYDQSGEGEYQSCCLPQ